MNFGRPSSFKIEHKEHIQKLLDKDPQLYADYIIESLTIQFMDFIISKPQLNHHLKNNMLISAKKTSFEPEARCSEKTLQTRYE